MLKGIKRMLSRKPSTPASSPKPTSSPKKSPTPIPSLPPNVMREIAKKLSPRNRRAFSTATSKYTRRTLPIGLAVTKVGAPIVSVNRPPVINRSMATAKTPIVRVSNQVINRIVPAAYKNPNWKYYAFVTSKYIAFKNTPNGPAYFVNKKTGVRKGANAVTAHLRRAGLRSDLLTTVYSNRWKPRTNKHTLQAYYKRANYSKRYLKGHWKRYDKTRAIGANVVRYKAGNTRALNKWSVYNLAWWADSSHLAVNGPPYVRRGGKLYRPESSNRPLTKRDILYNINLTNFN